MKLVEVACGCRRLNPGCVNCHGAGVVERPACKRCEGTGTTGRAQCLDCRGDGWRDVEMLAWG